MKHFVVLFAVVALVLIVAFAPQHHTTSSYTYEAKGNNLETFKNDLASCKRIYDEEYMPDRSKRESLTVQCMVIERGHGFIQTK